ncbi:unnamed protein product [Durusdinium trenchii]|uniref:Uncharacterized protein n=1 Tax=Durusdinium trenchii TaxID=1381693 RepID=A0ABP0I9W0_9DINO
MDGDTRRWVVGQVEDTALTGCKLLRSMLSDMGDVVCCLSGLGIATPISVVRPVGSVGLSRPPSLCEMLPVAHRRRNRPFEEKRVTDWSFEGLLDTPLRLFRSPGPPAPGRPEAASPEAPEEEGLQILSSNDLDALEGPVEIVEEHTFQEVYYLRDSRLVEGPCESPALSVWYLV